MLKTPDDAALEPNGMSGLTDPRAWDQGLYYIPLSINTRGLKPGAKNVFFFHNVYLFFTTTLMRPPQHVEQQDVIHGFLFAVL